MNLTRALATATLVALLPAPCAADSIACAPASATASACLRDYLAATYDVAHVALVVAPVAEEAHAVRNLQLLSEETGPRMAVLATTADGTSRSVWLRVEATRDVTVWTRSAPAGSPASAAAPRTKPMNIARWLDRHSSLQPATANRTLRRAVIPGTVALEDDLLATDAFPSGAPVRYRIADGAVVLRGNGRALQDGTWGSVARILPSNGTQPIEAIAEGKP